MSGTIDDDEIADLATLLAGAAQTPDPEIRAIYLARSRQIYERVKKRLAELEIILLARERALLLAPETAA